jgi:hypothetical protein
MKALHLIGVWWLSHITSQFVERFFDFLEACLSSVISCRDGMLEQRERLKI